MSASFIDTWSILSIISKILHHRKQILYRSPNFRKVFPVPLMAAYRKDAKVHSKHRVSIEKGLNGRNIDICTLMKFDREHIIDDKKYVFNDTV